MSLSVREFSPASAAAGAAAGGRRRAVLVSTGEKLF